MCNRTIFLICLTAMSLYSAVCYPTFEQFVAKYEKNYNQTQYAKRKQIYEARIKSFESITDYTPGVNSRSDWTDQQARSLATLQNLPSVQRSAPARVSATRVGVATSLDWREKNAVTSIKDQGSCGCCWAFASCAYAESRLILSNSQYTVNNINLSEQYLLKCTKYSDCQGGYLQYAMQTVTEVPTQDKYPYSPYSTNSGICWASGIRTGYTPQSYYSLSDTQLINLLQDGPVAIAISSVGWLNYHAGIFNCASNAAIDHAVLLIGYTPDYWIVKNQWGTDWGESGYIRVTRRTTNNCKIGSAAHVLYSIHAINYVFILLALMFVAMF